MVQRFDNGINLMSAVRTSMPDGSQFEGVGIKPDVEVLLMREDLYEDRDPVLLKAIEMAEQAIAG